MFYDIFSVPGPVSFFNHSMMTSTQVTLTWGLPLAPNGVITGFQVKREGLEKVSSIFQLGSGISNVL